MPKKTELETTKAERPRSSVLVWDFPIRLFHWAIVALVILQWWTAEHGHMGVHKTSGLTVLGLLVFRFYWGLFGSATARFSKFVKGPREVMRYVKSLQRPYTPTFGHNPAGALSVVAMLAALTTQVGTGLFAVDVDGIESGPLSNFVSFDEGRTLAEIHEASFDFLVALIVLHVAVIAFYFLALRVNLVTAMISGRGRHARADERQGYINEFPIMRTLVGVMLALASVALIVK